MKILVITPIYYIEGRENLFHDSSAVHYLLKYWPQDVQVLVIYTYFNSIKAIFRYADRQERLWHKNGCSYMADNIPVRMIETQLLPNQRKLNSVQLRRIKKQIAAVLAEEQFEPDKLICHIPAYKGIQFIDAVQAREKIAVLHSSDVKKQERDDTYLEQLDINFDRIYARSKVIYDYFQKKGLRRLKPEIINSGVQIPDAAVRRDFSDIEKRGMELLYVGKFITRKHIDLLLESLSELKKAYRFHLKLIGGGREEENLKNLVQKLGMEDCVEFIPVVPHERVFEYMRAADLFVMPSTEETLGLVYLEAMSMGCITVGTYGEGIDGIIQNNFNGFLVEPTAESIYGGLEQIFQLEVPELQRISDCAQKTASAHEERAAGLEYCRIITSGNG